MEGRGGGADLQLASAGSDVIWRPVGNGTQLDPTDFRVPRDH